MERIDEEDEDRASTSSSSDSDTSSTDSGRIDFVPFTWNSLAVPAKSVLKPTPCQVKVTSIIFYLDIIYNFAIIRKVKKTIIYFNELTKVCLSHIEN